MDSSIPPVHPRLIEALKQRIPDRCPKLDTPDRQVWFDSGRASVVQLLESWYEQQIDPPDPKE